MDRKLLKIEDLRFNSTGSLGQTCPWGAQGTPGGCRVPRRGAPGSQPEVIEGLYAAEPVAGTLIETARRTIIHLGDDARLGCSLGEHPAMSGPHQATANAAPLP